MRTFKLLFLVIIGLTIVSVVYYTIQGVMWAGTGLIGAMVGFWLGMLAEKVEGRPKK